MLMSCARLPWLLLLLLVAFGSQQYASAEVAVVSTPAQLQTALSDAAVGSIVLASQVLLDSDSFAPTSLTRPVIISSDDASKGLSFGSVDSALIRILPGGNLTLQGLIIQNFFAGEPMPVTSASSIMPISAISLSSWSSELVISACIMLVQGQLAAVSGHMPFWSAQLSNMVTSTPEDQSSQQQPIRPISARMTYFGGNSSVHILDSKLVVTPSDCDITAGTVVWDSYSLWSALQDTETELVALITSIKLSPQHFSPFNSTPVSSVSISSCSSSSPMTLDFNNLRSAVTLSQGSTLQLKDGLRLVSAAELSSASSDAFLLLGSVDISSGAQLVLNNVTVGVDDVSNMQQAIQQLSQISNSSAVNLQQASGAEGHQPAVFVVSNWDVNLGGTDVFGNGAATVPAGTKLVMERVTIIQSAESCFSAGSAAATVADDVRLRALLSDPKVTQIEVVADVKLHAAHWQGVGGLSGDLIEIARPLEMRACHPDAATGGRYTLDLSELQGNPILNLTSLLRISGDLILRGMPDREGTPGSWMVMPVVMLSGPEAALVFQDAIIVGRTGAPFTLLESSAEQFVASGDSMNMVNSSMMMLQQVKLSQSLAAQLFPGLSVSSGQSSSRRLLVSSSLAPSSSGGSSFYGYLGTGLSCDDTIPTAAAAAAAGKNLNTAALVLGILLGIVLLGVLGFVLAYAGKLRAHQRCSGMYASDRKLALCSCCSVPQSLEDDSSAWHQLNGAGRRAFHADHEETARRCIGGAESHMIDEVNDVALLGSLGGFDASGILCRLGSADDSRHGHVHTARFMPGLHSFPAEADQSQKASQQGVCTADMGPYERKTSGALEGERITSSRVVNLGGHILGTMTDANTTVTESGTAGGGGGGGAAAGGGQHKQQVFEDARKRLGATAGDLARSDALVLEAVLGEGTFGKVFKGYWKGTLVAVKTMMFPAGMSGKEKREKMAIMETAISASLSHPNIVQMYTYYLRPVLVGHEAQLTGQAGATEGHKLDSSSVGDSTMNAAFLNEGLSSSVHSWEVQLVLEYCDQGSLRSLLNKKGSLTLPDGGRDMLLIVDTALDVARAMVHLHSENIIHSDLKARNILLKSSGGADGRPFVAKVADFGLSMRIDPAATHVSNVFQGTMTHMAPEVMLQGKLSRNSDVYAFGILLWELYSGGHAFKGIPRALLGHEVAHNQRRPQFPEGSPFEYQLLACRCWESDASIRPSFQEILAELQRFKERLLAAAASSSLTLTSCERTSTQTLVSSQPVTSNKPLPQQQQLPATVSAPPAAAKSPERAHHHQQQQAGSENAAAVGPKSFQQSATDQAAANAAAAVSGSLQYSTGSLGRKLIADLQDEFAKIQQQLPTDADTANADTAAEQKDGGAPEHAVAGQQQHGWSKSASAVAEMHHHHQQQQQHSNQLTSKDHIPDHLLQQMSISVSTADMLRLGGSSDAPESPGFSSHAATQEFHTARNLPFTAESNVVQQQHGSGSSSGDGDDDDDCKSTYLDDLHDSTVGAHPRCVLYGAARHMQPRGLFKSESDSNAGTATDPAAAIAAAADDPTSALQAAANALVSGSEHGLAAAVTPAAEQQQGNVASDHHPQHSALVTGAAAAAGVQPMHLPAAVRQLSSSAAVPPPAAAVSEPLLASAAADQAQMLLPEQMLSLTVPEINVPAVVSTTAAAAASDDGKQQSGPRGSASAAVGRQTSIETGRSSAESASSSKHSVNFADRGVDGGEQQQQQQRHGARGTSIAAAYLRQLSENALLQQQHEARDVLRCPSSDALHAIRQQQQQQQQSVQHEAAAPSRPLQQVRFSLDEHHHHHEDDSQQQQQHSSLLRSPSASVPSMTYHDGSSSNSSSGMEPTSDSSNSRSRAAQSGSAAAMAAVLSLKAALAKRAMADRTTSAAAGANRQIAEIAAAAAAAGSSRAAQQVVSAAAAPVQDSRSGPLVQPPGYTAAEQAADAAKLLQQQEQQQQLSQPLPLPGLRPAAAVRHFSSFTLRRSMPESPIVTAAAAAPPSAVTVPEINASQRQLHSVTEHNAGAAAAAAGRFSLDARAHSVSVSQVARERQRPMPRAVVNAWGVVTGRISNPGSRPDTASAAAAAAAGNASSGVVHSKSSSPVPGVPGVKKFSLHRMVRKALSARELGSSATAAAAAGHPSGTVRSPSEPAVLGSAAAAAAAAASTSDGAPKGLQPEQQQQQQQQQQHPVGRHLPHQQQQVDWFQQATASSSTQLPEFAALDAGQLQMLAEIADAAKAQVAMPFKQLPRAATAAASSSSHAVGHQLLPYRSASTGLIGNSAAAAAAAGSSAALPSQAGLMSTVSSSDTNSGQQQQQQQVPPPRNWGGYLPAANTAKRFSADLRPSSSQTPAAAAAAAAGSTAGRYSLDTRRNQMAAAAAAPPAARGPGSSSTVLRFATQQQPLQQQQQGLGGTSSGGFGESNSRPGLSGGNIPSPGAKPRRASAPPQQPSAGQRERRGSVLSSIADSSGASYGSAAAVSGRSRRASAPPQQHVYDHDV